MSVFDTVLESCCGAIFVIVPAIVVSILYLLKKRKEEKHMNICSLKKADDSGVAIAFGGILLAGVIVIIVIAVIGLVFGIFTLIGMCLLAAAAYILFVKKGAVTFAPNSVFMWLLIIGLILVCFGQFVMDIGSVDLKAVPGFETIYDVVRP